MSLRTDICTTRQPPMFSDIKRALSDFELDNDVFFGQNSTDTAAEGERQKQ